MLLLAGPAPAQELPPPVPGFAAQGSRAVQEEEPRFDPVGDPIRGQFAQQLIQFDVPGPETLFRLESERDLEERIRQIALDTEQEAFAKPFPQLPKLTDEPYRPRSFPRQGILVEPHFVNHRRLYFQQLNYGRYGWDYGFFQPVISTAKFYKDVVFLPHNFGVRPHCRWESSAGYCYPGDPVPHLLYPPEIGPAGVAAQVGTVLGLAFIFP